VPSIDLVVESDISSSSRVKQLSGMFDVPPQKKCHLEWHGDLPIENKIWNVGLIVGPSGSGKSTIARKLWQTQFDATLEWNAKSVIDDFRNDLSIETISSACQSVGFNTIPAWMRPYSVLSNGEKFRVEMARRILELEDPIVCDEFTSVVDRQIAKIGAHAVQKFCRKNNRQFVAVTCHYDVIDWLQPDWIFEPHKMTLEWRERRRRPEIECEIRRVPYGDWRLFAPFHYMSAELNKAARCFGLFVNGRITSFAGILYRPHPTAKNIFGVSRLVTLPDWQGLGLAMALCDRVASAYRSIGRRVTMYPAHPALIRTFDKSAVWALKKKPGLYSVRAGKTSSVRVKHGRPCAVFEYCGAVMEKEQAVMLLAG
jgi:GNAT superfamily N-acetyltransferase